MTAERPVKVSVQKEIKLNKDAFPLISLETVVGAVPIAEHVVKGEKPESKEVSETVQHVAEDLRKQGILISSDDIRAIQKKANESFLVSESPKSEQKQFSEIDKTKLVDIDLHEYQAVVDNMTRMYGLDKGQWDTVSNIFVASTLVGDVISGLQNHVFMTDKGRKYAWGKFEEVGKDLRIEELSPKAFLDSLKNLKSDQTKDIGKKLFQGAWPFLISPVYWIMDRQGGKLANKIFLTERAKLQESVNNRIADSLYMRNFEFLHDKSEGEMMQIINNGKDATLDLMSAVHEELIPLKAAQWGSVGRLAFVNPWDAIAGLAKKWLLEVRIKPDAQQVQKQRVEELKRWDTVNNKLLTTLQGLETVRTAGNAEAGSDVLYQSLAERDFVEAGGMQAKRRQNRAMNTLFDVLDIGLPLVTEGGAFAWDLRRSDSDPKKEIRTAADMFNHFATAYFRITGSKAQQMELRQSFMQLTHLYVDRIIPDIQDIKRMDELLGPYEKLDHPMGLKERARVPATTLPNFDINVEHLNFKHILHDVNLDIPQGSFVTIKGPSGIGKSTLFRHLVGLYGGDSGTVSYGGVAIDGIKKYGDQSLYTKIAYANQNPQYFEDMTLRENLLLWTKNEIPNEKIEGVLRDLKLDQLIDRLDIKSKHYSGGEMRRIGIARALLKDPRVLFLDEPTANLDAVSTVQVLKIIQDLRKKRPDMTVVAITHDPVFEKISEKIVDFEQINKKPALLDHQVMEAMAKPMNKS